MRAAALRVVVVLELLGQLEVELVAHVPGGLLPQLDELERVLDRLFARLPLPAVAEDIWR